VLPTTATTLLAIERPVIQAGMAKGYTGAGLVAAVSGAGGLGILGCLNRTRDETVSELAGIRQRTDRPFGVGFVVEHLDEDAFQACLDAAVPAVMFFRGDPATVVERAKRAGCVVLYQITTVAEAIEAASAGADILIAQGQEAGGHVGPEPLARLLPAVTQTVPDRPVLAAGGIVDGEGLAEVIHMGAAGACLGTRFLATHEAPASAGHKQAIVEAKAGSTIRSPMWDLIWGRPWPGVEVRAIANAITDRWADRPSEVLAHRDAIRARLETAIRADEVAEMDLLAGAGVGRIATIRAAGALVVEIADDAHRILSDDQARGASRV
jgi:NAD(P)H-dependent flavin oxidoreductase YrpB (nitropropane dioxygenase family)